MLNFKNNLYSIIFIIIIFIINLCQSSTFYNQRKYFDSLETPVVMITNKSLNGLLDETMVQYGSLFHPKYVLTFADILKQYRPEDLLIRLDCYSDWFIFKRSCPIREQVSRFKLIRSYYRNSTEIKSLYGIIVLENWISLSARTQPVRLALSDDIVDHSNCLIYSYIHHDNLNNFVSYISPIRAQEINGSYVPMLSKTSRVVDDYDRELELERIVSEVDFYGSPVVCALGNSTFYVQVGISNLKIVLPPYSRRISFVQANPQIGSLSTVFSPQETFGIRMIKFAAHGAKYSAINILS